MICESSTGLSLFILSHCGHRSRVTGGLKRSLAVGDFAYGIRRYFVSFGQFKRLIQINLPE